MNNPSNRNLSSRLARLMRESSQRSSQVHAQFLRQRAASLDQVRQLIEMQMGGVQPGLSQQPAEQGTRAALFDSRQLEEFGKGSISGCFGPGFARYDGRRIPRIPNGDLRMMSRVVGIRGSLSDLDQPADIDVEYDVPQDAWYFSDRSSFELPYFLLMETALQPCGFLSAYLDTYALVPHERFYFRNLDGSARVVDTMDVRGKILTTHARLQSSVASGGTVIQKFSFSVTCAGREIYQGESTFGYFSAETMANQVGLDGGQTSLPWIRQHPGERGETLNLQQWRTSDARQTLHLATGRLNHLEEVFLSPHGGKFGQGYLHALRPVNPRDWFYQYHFFGDPVMPGSLGVEAVLEALKAYALAQNPGGGLRTSQFMQPVGEQPTTWRYRGQITPQHKMMELEVHLKSLERHEEDLVLAGNASVWVDGLRIYEVMNASLRIHEMDK